MSRPTLLLVLAVLAATAVAFAETERLKVASAALEGANVQPVFSPVCRCAQSRAEIRLRVHKQDDITVTVLNAAGHTVRVLASSRPVPDGTYSVHVDLAFADRTIDLPKHVVVDTAAPTAQLVGYQPHVVRRGPKV